MITTKKCNKIIAILFFDSKEDDDNGTRIIIRFPHLHPFEIYFDLPKKKIFEDDFKMGKNERKR